MKYNAQLVPPYLTTKPCSSFDKDVCKVFCSAISSTAVGEKEALRYKRPTGPMAKDILPIPSALFAHAQFKEESETFVDIFVLVSCSRRKSFLKQELIRHSS